MNRVHYQPNEKTRWFSTQDGDKFLCKFHAEGRLHVGQHIGIPSGGAGCLFGARAFPTGQEACDDCNDQPRMTNGRALDMIALLNMKTLRDYPEVGCAVIQDAATMVGIALADVKVNDKGEYSCVMRCQCGQRNRVRLVGNGGQPACGKCKEAL